MDDRMFQPPAAPEWKWGRNGRLLVAHDGLILGEVSASFSGRHIAVRGNKTLGEFYTETQAMAAVDRAGSHRGEGEWVSL